MTLISGNNKGFMLLTSMIILLGASTFLASTYFYVKSSEKDLILLQKRKELAAISESLRNSLQYSESLKNSYEDTSLNNTSLRNCVLDSGSCEHNKETPLLIKDHSNARVIIGNQSNPTRVDFNGTLCDNQSSASFSCPLVTYATMVPQCPSSIATCQAAQFIDFNIIVSVDSTLKSSLKIPDQHIQARILRSQIIDGSISCPQGEYIQSIDHNRQVTCLPIADILKNIRCPSEQFLRGINNGTPLCSAP